MTQANNKSNTKSQPDNSLAIDTLIITVGTRQIGWRCDDGIVRCFGADGDRNAPPHTNELYENIGVERKFDSYLDPYTGEPRKSQWRMRDLGNRYYDLATVKNDFSAVELLIDNEIR